MPDYVLKTEKFLRWVKQQQVREVAIQEEPCEEAAAEEEEESIKPKSPPT